MAPHKIEMSYGRLLFLLLLSKYNYIVVDFLSKSPSYLSLPSVQWPGMAVKNSLPFSYFYVTFRVLFISLFPWTGVNSFDFRLSCGNFRSVNSRVLLFHPLNKPSIANYIWVCFCLKELWFLKPKLIFAVRLENGPAGLSSPFVVSLFDGSNFFSWAQWRHFKLQ